MDTYFASSFRQLISRLFREFFQTAYFHVISRVLSNSLFPRYFASSFRQLISTLFREYFQSADFHVISRVLSDRLFPRYLASTFRHLREREGDWDAILNRMRITRHGETLRVNKQVESTRVVNLFLHAAAIS